MAIEKVKSHGNDLPTPGAMTSSVNGALSAMAPADMAEIKAALMKHGGKLKHAGGALPPLFPDKGIREGDARLAVYLGFDIVPEDRIGGKGGAAVALNFDVLDHAKASLPVAYRAQLWLNATMETYFKCEEVAGIDEKDPVFKSLGGKKKVLDLEGVDGEFVLPTREVETTPILLITYAGTAPAKKSGFSPTKRWIFEEFTPAKS